MVKKLLRMIDPFYHFDRLWEKYVGVGGWVKVLADVVFTVFVAFLLYSLLGLLLNTPRPAVIVASSSMEPLFYPGDIVIVRGISPEEIAAPTVEVNTTLNYRVLPEQVGIGFVRKGVRLVGFEVNGTFIPLDGGTVIVYRDDLRNRDVIHRAVLKVKTPSGYFFVTKGDNPETNPTADQDCVLGYCVYPFLVSEDQVLGTPVLVIPRIGIVKLLIFPSG